MQTTRKIGIEMEGYIDNYPSNISIAGVRIGSDGSLDYSDWEEDDSCFGVELTTKPLRDLSILHDTWKDMQYHGWTTDSSAGTHIHVDISDFSSYEMVKLLRFGIAIERIMFMFVQSYRNDNSYCTPLHKEWRKMLRPTGKYNSIEWDALKGKNEISERLREFSKKGKKNKSRYSYGSNDFPWNGKYQWMNVLGSSYTTVEFRLFHAVEDIEEVITQARLAEAIVNFAKNTSLEQMEYVIHQLYAQNSVKDLTELFFGVLGLDFQLPTVGQEAYMYLVDKLGTKKVKAVKKDSDSDKLAKLMQA